MVLLSVWDNYHDPEYFIKHIYIIGAFQYCLITMKTANFNQKNKKYIYT